MANAHFFSAGLELPNQGMAPVVTPSAHLDDDIDKKDGDIQFGDGVEERIGGDDALIHEQAMPEGPTVTRWEEWAYVRSHSAPLSLLSMLMLANNPGSIYTIMVILEWDRMVTLRRYSKYVLPLTCHLKPLTNERHYGRIYSRKLDTIV